MKRWSRALYQPNLPLNKDGFVTASKEHIALSKRAATEGMVLLKNERDVLPLAAGSRIALFGKGSFDYVKGGGGSGDVVVAYVRSLYDGLKAQEEVSVWEPLCDYYRDYVNQQYAQGAAPGMMAEPEVPFQLVNQAKANADAAVIAISRFSGEGWDRSDIEFDNGEYNPWEAETSMPQTAGRIFPKGDFYLTDEERAMVEAVCAAFDRVAVVLNVGGVVDTTWFKEDERISSVLLAYQGGMEGGTAMAELLVGKANPCGKLTDTFACDIGDYPSTEHFHDSPYYVDYTEDIYVGYRYFETLPGKGERVCYPFGFGLSYTSFRITPVNALEQDGEIVVTARVDNTGDRAGKEVVQLYYSAPQGVLQKPARALAAFRKTGLLAPGESETVELRIAAADMASYDDLGKICKSAYVLEKGAYTFFLGNSVRDAVGLDYTYTVAEDTVVKQLSQKSAPTSLAKRLLADGSYEALPQSQPNDPNACPFPRMSPGSEEAVVPATRGRERYLMMHPYADGVKPLEAVAEGEITLDEFIAQLSDDDLIHLTGGQPNTSVSNTFGMGNLPEYGVPNVTTADGPAGLRLSWECGVCTTAWPCATLLAATWDPELVTQVGAAGGGEVRENNLAIWLTPAVNIHRSPLCGRNFEYYSEDPYLTGKIGAAMVRGIQSQGVGASVKHFACNNKETNRKHSDSRVSERALREIYLKGFEIIVRESQPWTIMSAYNIINGHRASECRELLVDVLRGEWDFQGLVTSDWWTRGEHFKEIKAGNDVKMATGYPERVKKAMELGQLDRSDLEYCARHVLELILKMN